MENQPIKKKKIKLAENEQPKKTWQEPELKTLTVDNGRYHSPIESSPNSGPS